VTEAIGDVLALAVAAAISPFPIIGVVLMLVTPRGRTNGLVFVVGWLAGLAVVGAVTLAVANISGASDDGEPTAGVNLLQIALGVALLVLATRQWRKRPRPHDPPTLPNWMSAVERFTPLKAAGTGVAMSAVNPKNLLLTVAAASAIAGTGLPGSEQVIAYVV
jgi:threonine/homoserine/homoserine lactone efflux protein